MMSRNGRKRVVIAGLGDTGLLVALDLGAAFEVVGIAPRPGLVSGQELGTRLARPDAWRRDYLVPFSRYRGLRHATLVHGLITRVDAGEQRVQVRLPDGGERSVAYDALVIASGVTSGFWRQVALEDLDAVRRRVDADAARLASAATIAVVGGGASGVSAASNLKEQFLEKQVHLFFSQEAPLPGYHPAVRAAIVERLRGQGVVLHAGHRAELPDGFDGGSLTRDAVRFQAGRPPFQADAVLWAVGRPRPNTGFLPRAMLDADGYVAVDAFLRVPGFPGVFAVGDVASTDPHRSSARNSGFLIAAHNVRAYLAGREGAMKRFSATPHRWGSILGVQRDGLRVFAPGGRSVLIGPWWTERVLFPWVVRRLIYKGIDG